MSDFWENAETQTLVKCLVYFCRITLPFLDSVHGIVFDLFFRCSTWKNSPAKTSINRSIVSTKDINRKLDTAVYSLPFLVSIHLKTSACKFLTGLTSGSCRFPFESPWQYLAHARVQWRLGFHNFRTRLCACGKEKPAQVIALVHCISLFVTPGRKKDSFISHGCHWGFIPLLFWPQRRLCHRFLARNKIRLRQQSQLVLLYQRMVSESCCFWLAVIRSCK